MMNSTFYVKKKVQFTKLQNINVYFSLPFHSNTLIYNKVSF